jgi:hypothetical protein
MSENLDEFLSAPDNVRMNEKEKAKYLQRKAHETALEQQELASKSSEVPSIEDMLTDMVRVAEDEETNPYYADRTLSRKRYKRYGHYPILFIEREFGTFDNAKSVANLADTQQTRSQKLARANQSKKEHAGRYQERWMLPHSYDPKTREDTLSILSISDTHSTFLDPFTWTAFLRTAKHIEPDIIYLNGDILEGAAISRHPKIPGWAPDLQTEFDFCRSMFVMAREAAPDAEIIWGAGNHGLDRWAMYLSQVAPALAGLRTMRFDQLMDLDGLGIKLAQSGTWASPAGTEDIQPGTLFNESYLVYHGHALGQTPYLTELRDHQYSGQSGHVHRAGMAYSTSEEGGAKSWMSTPMGCVPRAGRSYLFKKRNTGWQTGFGVAFLSDCGNRVHQYPVVTSQGFAFVEGMQFENLGMPEPDPNTNWIQDYEWKI